MFGQFVNRQSSLRFDDHASRYEFAPLGIGHSEDRDFSHGGVLIEDRFHFAGVDVFSSGNNHVFHTVENVEVPIGGLVTNVSRAK